MADERAVPTFVWYPACQSLPLALRQCFAPDTERPAETWRKRQLSSEGPRSSQTSKLLGCKPMSRDAHARPFSYPTREGGGGRGGGGSGARGGSDGLLAPLMFTKKLSSAMQGGISCRSARLPKETRPACVEECPGLRERAISKRPQKPLPFTSTECFFRKLTVCRTFTRDPTLPANPGFCRCPFRRDGGAVIAAGCGRF